MQIIKINFNYRYDLYDFYNIEVNMYSIKLNTYAKINISLDITGVRKDGYHEVSMVMQGIDLYDEMTVGTEPVKIQEPAIESAKADNVYCIHKDADNRLQFVKYKDEAGNFNETDLFYVEIILAVDRADLPVDSRNTAYKAAQIVLQEYPEAVIRLIEQAGRSAGHSEICNAARININIKKNIPAAAGLAGGSSNAAGVLLALNKLLGLDLSLNELCRLGKKIGADVPFCIMSTAARSPELGVQGGFVCALSEGIGEILTPLPAVSAWAVLAKPDIGVSTAEVYKFYDNINENSVAHPNTQLVIDGIKSGDMLKISRGMANVLENVTLIKHDIVNQLKEKMLKFNADMTMMSGSGPTVFSLFSDKNEAEALFEHLQKEFSGKNYDIICVKTL